MISLEQKHWETIKDSQLGFIIIEATAHLNFVYAEYIKVRFMRQNAVTLAQSRIDKFGVAIFTATDIVDVHIVFSACPPSISTPVTVPI